MSRAKPAGSRGFIFPLMLVILAAVAFAAMRLEFSGGYRLRRDKEDELLFRGKTYIRGIKDFFARNKRYPRDLKELIGDGGERRRYIRQLYKDPMTGGEFIPIRTSGGLITGVASASRETPFRKVDFDKDLESFEDAKTYADWKFSALPPAVPASQKGGAASQPVGSSPNTGSSPY